SLAIFAHGSASGDKANHCGKASKLGDSENNGEKDAEGEGKVSKPFPARIAKCLEYFCNSSNDVTHVVPYFQSGVLFRTLPFGICDILQAKFDLSSAFFNCCHYRGLEGLK